MYEAKQMNPAAVTTGDYETRFPDVFNRSFFKRNRTLVVIAAALAYLSYSWWFFAIGNVLGRADWSIAGSYLADWVSYEVRPDIRIQPDGTMRIIYPPYTPIGDNPNPDWMEKASETKLVKPQAAAIATPQTIQPKPSTGFMAPGAATGTGAGMAAATAPVSEDVVSRAVVSFTDSKTIEVAGRTVVVTNGAEKLVATLSKDKGVGIEGYLPSWATQREPGSKIILSFGLSGWAEIDDDRVRIRKRFLGWANFVFDTNSPYFGKTTSEVLSLIRSDQRIDPKQSNLALAFNNVLYNSEWQHLDVWTKLLQTIVMAFVGTLFATLIAFPLSFMAARNVIGNRLLNQVTKRFFDFLRSVDMLIWALFFTRGFGPGPLAGISAIFFTDTGSLGKLYAEALENIDNKQREGVRSVGAHPVAVQRFGVLPQVMPLFASQALYYWESNTRSATIIGAVGAGGIGLKLWEAMRTNSDWENVAYMVLLILMVVYIFDMISGKLRSMLMGRQQR
jgi:phosphonate transport system permease protein